MASDGGYSNLSMQELFRIEVEQQVAVLTKGLLSVEKSKEGERYMGAMMRAAHSIKGAARLVNRPGIVELAHGLEDCISQLQKGQHVLKTKDVDALLRTVDLIQRATTETDSDKDWFETHRRLVAGVLHELRELYHNVTAAVSDLVESRNQLAPREIMIRQADRRRVDGLTEAGRTLRVAAEQLDRLMAIAGETTIQSRRLTNFKNMMRRLKREHLKLLGNIELLREDSMTPSNPDAIRAGLVELQQRATQYREWMEEQVAEVEAFDIKLESIVGRLQKEVLNSRMRPFGDGVSGLPRLVRDVSVQLGKQVELSVTGLDTKVDRDVLERIEAPLSHLLNNAIDHGIEMPDERIKKNKSAAGTIQVNAHHRGGWLFVTVEDDGTGIDFEQLRRRVIERGFVTPAMGKRLTQEELINFLFLPGFSTRDQITQISGRGVGLDVVKDVIEELHGAVEATSAVGKGTIFKIRLPLTLSLVPALLVDIGKELYAFPIGRVKSVERIQFNEIQLEGGRQFWFQNGRRVDLVQAAEILELGQHSLRGALISIVVLEDRAGLIGCVVDRLRNEADLVVSLLPSQVGKIQDIENAAFTDDGTPVLILDLDDFMRSARKVLEQGSQRILPQVPGQPHSGPKRILIVDDSITVRELERKLLTSAGYLVDVAVDGMDGWNALRAGAYDLLITDVDMPRLNGFQLTRMVKQDPGLRQIPILVVTYKDQAEDENRAYSVGAEYFLSKANFHDDALTRAVRRILGGTQQ